MLVQHHGDEQDMACLLSCKDVRSWCFSSFVPGCHVCKDTQVRGTSHPELPFFSVAGPLPTKASSREGQ